MTQIQKRSKFVVQTDDSVNSVTAETLKTYTSPLAKRPNEALGNPAVPGLMYPGMSLIYNEVSGELNVNDSELAVVKEYVGLVGYEEGQTSHMEGNEEAGEFYIVADFKYKYTQNDWGTSGSDRLQQERVYCGDILEKKNDGTGDWAIIPMQVGNRHVSNNFTNYPHISTVNRSNVVASAMSDADDNTTIIEVSGAY